MLQWDNSAVGMLLTAEGAEQALLGTILLDANDVKGLVSVCFIAAEEIW